MARVSIASDTSGVPAARNSQRSSHHRSSLSQCTPCSVLRIEQTNPRQAPEYLFTRESHRIGENEVWPSENRIIPSDLSPGRPDLARNIPLTGHRRHVVQARECLKGSLLWPMPIALVWIRHCYSECCFRGCERLSVRSWVRQSSDLPIRIPQPWQEIELRQDICLRNTFNLSRMSSLQQSRWGYRSESYLFSLRPFRWYSSQCGFAEVSRVDAAPFNSRCGAVVIELGTLQDIDPFADIEFSV